MSTEVSPEAHEVSPIAAKAARVEHFSVGERAARGKAARADVPRTAHAAWEPPPLRRSPLDLLEEQAKTRVPELVPIRYGRMLVSPFTFYRGAAYIMASDLAGMPRTGLHTQLCGDAHLSNFGAFAAPDRQLVFSINDFDETLPGPFEWDVKRLVASFAVAGRDRGFSDKERAAVNLTVGRAYREAIAGYAGRNNLDLWYSRLDVEKVAMQLTQGFTREQIKRYEGNLAKTKTKTSLKAFGKLTEVVNGEPHIISDPPVVVPMEELFGAENAHKAARVHARRDPLVQANARRRPAEAPRAVPLRRCRPQGRRGRQCRHTCVHHADARPRR